ncbi:hypothetical protein BBK82_46700 [Lentzea guizhouensis]|uniref:Uncharacterized protein n=1 Tax=Lentzea guizhouensis TaxID=1586287 RepID=A0A1B2HX86_9PSEU|nr:hypothetical protein BBK82_46700 [Lentzea guizhouensis]
MWDAGGHVVQAGTIHGGVHLGDTQPAPHNNEIGVYLRADRAEVCFRTGAAEPFELTITNRTPRDRKLFLRFESASTTGLLWEHADTGVPEVFAVPADRSLQLRLRVICTAEALAGPDVLKVLAGELDPRTGEPTWWSSDSLPIEVNRAPGLTAELRQPEDVYDAGPYETVLTLTNTGNTVLKGRLRLRTEFDGPEHPEWLHSGKVTFPDGPHFDLRPGTTTDVRVTVEVPFSDWQDTTWLVPLAVQVEGDDAPRVDQDFTIRQRGDLVALWQWGRTPDAWKRRTIVAGAIVLFALGISLGAAGDRSGGAADPSGQTNAAVSAPSSSGVRLSSAKMPCEQGKSVLVLHSLEDSTTPADVKLYLDYEAMWARKHLPGGKPPDGAEVRLSTRDDTCPKVLQGPTPDKDTEAKYTWFVWLGTVPSNGAPALCQDFYRKAGKNCLPAGVA